MSVTAVRNEGTFSWRSMGPMWFLVYRVTAGLVGVSGFVLHSSAGQGLLLPVLLLLFGGVASLVTDPLMVGKRPFTLRNGIDVILYVGGVSALSRYHWPFTLALLTTASGIALLDVTTLVRAVSGWKLIAAGNVGASPPALDSWLAKLRKSFISPRVFGLVTVLAGAAVTLLCALADLTGIGAHPEAFGPRQIMGTTVGVLIFFVGVVELVRVNRKSG